LCGGKNNSDHNCDKVVKPEPEAPQKISMSPGKVNINQFEKNIEDKKEEKTKRQMNRRSIKPARTQSVFE